MIVVYDCVYVNLSVDVYIFSAQLHRNNCLYFPFLMDREIYHTLCIVYYNNHYV